MKAIVYEKYGPPEVLTLKEVPTPSPNDNEVLIKIHATTVTSADRRLRCLDVPIGFGLLSRLALGLVRPRQPILGSELAGEVVQIGKKVTKFKIGDLIFGNRGSRMGCYAQYTCLREDAALARKPENLSFGQAAALSFGGTTALDFFSRGKLARGEKVLINGASGAVGTAAVQLAKHFGAQVSAVCSTANIELVTTLGADHVIDYTQIDFTRSNEHYDVIVDIAGTAPYSRSKHVLAEKGRYLMVLGGLPDMLQIPWVHLTSRHRIVAGPARERAQDLQLLANLAEKGLFKPVIDRCYPLEEIVAAHRYVDMGHKRGNVIIAVSDEGTH